MQADEACIFISLRESDIRAKARVILLRSDIRLCRVICSSLRNVKVYFLAEARKLSILLIHNSGKV